MQPRKESPAPDVKPKPHEPRLYTPDELDLADKELSRKLKSAGRTLSDAQLQELQERGIDSPTDDVPSGHIDNVFFNHKIVQPTAHPVRRALFVIIFVTFLVYFLLWAMGVTILPSLNV